MSFHKRFYSWESIKQKSQGEFVDFDFWICKPDAHVLTDNDSQNFFQAYFNLNGDKSKEALYNLIKKENYLFIKDLIKCINLVNNLENNNIHNQAITSYKNLFLKKWKIKALEYPNLINKQNG